jgi:hypothetical protein
MIGDKRYTEATDTPRIRPRRMVGERSVSGKAEGEPTVKDTEVRMQT